MVARREGRTASQFRNAASPGRAKTAVASGAGMARWCFAVALCALASAASAQTATPEPGVGKNPASAGASTTASAIAPSATAKPTTNPADLKELRPGILPGYLSRDAAIDSLALLGPAPEAGSAVAALDEATRMDMARLRDTPRWKVAARDASYQFPGAADAFACAVGVRIDEKATPHLTMLLRRTLTDAGLATYKAKNRYNRIRPYVAAKDGVTCYEGHQETLRNDGSYPSGHAAFGWAWALVLTEALPQEANAIIRRGYEFGQSRVICGYHWQSDVNAGRLVGAAVVAQLHANPEFVAQLAEAKKEISAARSSGAPQPDCALDKAAAQP